MIERYYHKEEGYNPFLIRTGWQVAQLNYVPTHGLDDIDTIEVHHNTDEVFILLEGKAVLVSATVVQDDIRFEAITMRLGVTYNVPQGAWHNIAMDRSAKIIIVERDNTHKTDVQYIYLTDAQRKTVYAQIAQVVG